MTELDRLFIKYGSDKSSQHHNYSTVYESFLSPYRDKPLIFLELGVGSYHFVDQGGHSLRAWKEYLRKASIYGLDIYDKSKIDESRITTFICSQDDEDKINKIIDSIGTPDVIIDDASHHNDLTIKSFEILFPRLKSGGIYFVEDVHTSYWEAISVTGEDFKGGNHDQTVMNYFKRKTDTINHHASGKPNEQIASISFYKEIIVITKL